ncbi:hypothetical protein IJ707_01725 [bacterium]|nr:hypothetical protein [bacterium]
MKKIILLIFIVIFLSLSANAFEYDYTSDGFKYVKHEHNEASYQHAWCGAKNGVEEYQNTDFTRVDCLTDENAVEFDFANKWAESIGQALHYQLMTGKKGKVVLILEHPQQEMVYYNRVKALADIYNFDAEYITPDILCLKKDGTCPYINCKCNKKKQKINTNK